MIFPIYHKRLYQALFKCLLIVCGILFTINVNGAAISSIRTGLWSSPSTWSTGAVPTTSSNVTISNGTTVTLDVTTTIKALTVGGGTSGTLLIGNTGAVTLTVTNAITVSAGATFEPKTTLSATHTINSQGNISNSGTMNMSPNSSSLCNIDISTNSTVTGTITFNDLSISAGNFKTVTLSSNETLQGNLTVTSATLACSGNLTVTGNVDIIGTLTFTTGILTVGGNFTNNGVFTEGTGTVLFNGSATQTISGPSATVFNNLTINTSGSTVQLGIAITVSATLLLKTGTLDVSTSNYGITFNATTGGAFTNNASTTAFNGRGGTVTFSGSKTLGGTFASTLFNATISFGQTLTLSQTETIQGTLTITGTLSNSATSPLIIGTAFTNNGTFSNNGGAVWFQNNPSSTSTLGGTTATTFDSLNINLTHSTDTVFMQNGITAKNKLHIWAGVMNCQTYNITGNVVGKMVMGANTTLVLGLKSSTTAVTFPSTYTAANISLANTSTVIFQANAAQVIPITPTYGNLNIYTGGTAVTKTLSAIGTLSVAGNLTLGNAITARLVTLSTATSAITVTGNVLVNTDGEITYTTGIFTAKQNVINSGIINNTAVGQLLVTDSVDNKSGATVSLTTGTLTISGNMLNKGIISYTGTGAFNIAGDFINDATFTPNTTTALFNNASSITQVLGGTATTSFYALTISGYNVILAHNENVTNNLLITSGTFDGGAGSYTLNVAGNFTNNSTFTGDNGTVVMNGAGAQTIGGTKTSSFYNLTCNPSTGVTVTLGIAETVSNNLLLSNGTLDVSAFNYGLTVGGSFTNNKAFTARNGTVTMNGTGTIGGSVSTSFYKLTISGTAITLAAAEIVTNNLLLSSGTLDVSSSNYTLTVGGNFTNNATFNAEKGTVTFNGASTQSISGTSKISFYNATLSGSTITLNSNESLQNALTVNSGALNGPDSLTMISNSTLTARIALVAAAATIGAPFIMQRYISGTSANYQALASPSQASTLRDWAYDAGFYMSGVGGPYGVAGGYNSVYIINETTDTYVPVTSTSTALTPGKGIYLWMGNSLTSLSPFTFATHGVPNFHNVTYAITDNNKGSNLIGNPYDCPLTWTLFHTTNSTYIGSTFSIFDETTGNWETSNGTTGSGGRLAANPNIIPAHQGFLVAASRAGTLTFTEAQKSTTDAPLIRPVFVEKDILQITLTGSENMYSGHSVLQFKSGTTPNFHAGEDVHYTKSLTLGAPELYTMSSDKEKLSWNMLPAKQDSEQNITLFAGDSLPGTYALTFNGVANLTSYNCVQLEDLKLGILTQIEEGTVYTYKVLTPGTTQFILHFKWLHPGEDCAVKMATNTSSLSGLVAVYSNSLGAQANFSLPENEHVIISVYNTLGERVMQDITTDILDGQVNIPLPKTNSVYIIRVQLPGGVVTNRVFH